MNHNASQPQQHDGSESALHGWSQRLGLSFEEFEAVMAVGQALDESQAELPLLAPDIAAGFVC